MTDQFNSDEMIAKMKRAHGSKFAPCQCGRTAVLLYRKAHGDFGTSNGPDADRYTLHDTPDRHPCPHGGTVVPAPTGAAS